MKRHLLWLLPLLPAILVALSCGSCITRDLRSSARRPVEAIRAEILAATPIGTPHPEVHNYAESHFDRVFGSTGLGNGDNPKLWVDYGAYSEARNFPFATVVRVTWYFDSEKKLETVKVFRFMDAP